MRVRCLRCNLKRYSEGCSFIEFTVYRYSPTHTGDVVIYQQGECGWGLMVVAMTSVVVSCLFGWQAKQTTCLRLVLHQPSGLPCPAQPVPQERAVVTIAVTETPLRLCEGPCFAHVLRLSMTFPPISTTQGDGEMVCDDANIPKRVSLVPVSSCDW